MNYVICEVMGTYNAMCIVNGNTDDVDFFRLSAEFDSGRLPFDKHTAKKEHQSYSNKIENELKQGKSAILSYTFNFTNIHTYALRYNLKDSFTAYNRYSNDDSPSNAPTVINSMGDNRYFYVGYVLY